MPSIFRHISDADDESGSESEASSSEESSDDGHVTISDDPAFPHQGPVTRVSSVVARQLSSHQPHEQSSMALGALIEHLCRMEALRNLNQGRDDADFVLPGSDEEKALTSSILDTAGAQLGMSKNIVGPESAEIRDAYLSGLVSMIGSIAGSQLVGPQPSDSFANENHPNDNSACGETVDRSLVPSFLPPVAQHRLSLRGSKAVAGTPPSLRFGEGAPVQSQSQYATEYKEIASIGKGGYGHVFKVVNFLDDQEYAIKKIPIASHRLKKFLDPAHAAALLSEVRTLANLHHCNVVRYFHAWMETAPRQTKMLSPRGQRMLTETQSTLDSSTSGSDYATGTEGIDPGDESQHFSVRDFNEEELQNAVCFGYSDSRSQIGFANRGRRESQATVSSATTLHATVHSAEDDSIDNDPEIETIPRSLPSAAKTSSHDQPSTIPSGDPSSPYGMDLTLYIKMSLHPTTLQAYLSPDHPTPDDLQAIRHCFHSEVAAQILLAILDGVDYLHIQRIVHRDLKPANIFLSVDNKRPTAAVGCIDITSCPECKTDAAQHPVYITPCIGDFGLIAKISDSDDSGSDGKFKPSKLSALHNQAGTQLYRPPTMPKVEPVICPRLDIYSLGVIAFELVYKFDTKSERADVLTKLNKGIIPVDFEDHQMASGIQAMVCEDRDKRWDSATVRNWLESFSGKGKGRS